MPRRIRRRIRVEAAAEGEGGDHNEDVVRQQEEILQSQFPTLTDGTEEGEGDASDSQSLAPSDTIPEDPESPTQSSLDVASPPSDAPDPSHPATAIDAGPSSASRGLIARARQAIQSTAHLSQYAPHSSTPNPSISADGKWKPTHHWSHFYDMMYAKRCMAILTHRSPRKSNLVIMKGKQWIVDWATGALTRCEPPDYGELSAIVAKENAPRVRAAGQLVSA